MPQGPGTYGSQRGRPPKKSGFKLKSGNTAPFKQMGSSPLKQDYHEVLEHHKKYTKEFKFKQATKEYNKLRSAMFGPGKQGLQSYDLQAKWNRAVRPTRAKFGLKEVSKATSTATKTSTASKVLNVLGKMGKVASKVLSPVAVGEFLYSGYTSGQKSSGGRYGFKQNPNYNPAIVGPKHGDASDNAKFIPTKGLYKDMYSSGPSKIIKPK